MLLSPAIRELLKEQITVEVANAMLYKQFGLVLANFGWSGSAKWFKDQSIEEQSHSDAIAEHFLDRSRDTDLEPAFYRHIIVPDLPGNSPLDMFRTAYVQELANTARLKNIYMVAWNESDIETVQFIADFIKEQTASEAEITTLLARLDSMAGDRAALEMFDHSLMD